MVSPTTTLNSAIDAMVIATIDDPGIFLVSQSEDLLGAGPFASAPEQIDTIQGLLWARRLGRHAPELLAEALGHPVTRRVVLIGEFVAAVAEAAAAGWVVPSSSTDGSLFATPTSPEIRSAQQALGEAGFGSMLLNDVLLDLGWSITERWVPDRRVTIDEDSHLAMKAWSRRLSLRMNAGARTLIRLEPPTNFEEGWLVIPTLVSLDDPELTAEASLALRPGSRLTEDFPGSGEDLRELVTAEWTSVAAALPELGEHPRVVEVDDDTVTTLLDAGADRDVAGLELLAPVNEFTSGELVTRAFASGQPSGLHLAELTLTVEAEVILADGTRVSVSEVELSQLEGGGTGLVNLGGRWVRIDPESAEHAADLLQRAAKKVSAAELLYAGQGIDIGDVEGWVGDALNGKPWPGITPKNPAPGFMAELRPYQRDGLGWLAWLEQVGMGGILADDMGLGKTCQVLARIYEDHEGPTLVVCPAVVVENWARETARFAPSLRVGVFHGAQRRSASALAEAHDLVITTYDLLRRDRSLREQPWHRVVLDEAQAIKNPKTKVAIAARELVAPHRLALTGTPVENHLGDLWSIMQFVEPGLLGKRSKGPSQSND